MSKAGLCLPNSGAAGLCALRMPCRSFPERTSLWELGGIKPAIGVTWMNMTAKPMNVRSSKRHAFGQSITPGMA